MRRLLPVALAVLLAAGLAAAPAQGARSIRGTWVGTVRIVKGGEGTFPMRMRITRTRVGARAGTLSNPGTPCRGTLRILRRRNGGYDMRYRERSRSSTCTGNDRVFVRRRGARLLWRGVSPDRTQIGRALLRRAVRV